MGIKSPPYSLTNESVSIVWEGKPHVFKEGHTQWHVVRDAMVKAVATGDWSPLGSLLTSSGSLQKWLGDKFVVVGSKILHQGIEVPAVISQRILSMIQNGEDAGSLFKFYERLAKNPSFRSVQQLWGFLEHMNIPIEDDGTFLAYKGVRTDYYDQHTGTFLNTTGQVLKMPRNQISDDPKVACHVGFHVGALSYASGFGPRTVVVRVDPEHVVCVPEDHSAQKMRVCEYVVAGNYSGRAMPSTSFKVDTDDDPEWTEEELESMEASDEALTEGEIVEAGPPTVAKIEVVKIVGKPTAKADSFNKMNMTELMSQSLDDLRKYAGNYLKIIGASKLPGGKSTLVSAIMKVRKTK